MSAAKTAPTPVDRARTAAGNAWFKRAARLGYVVRGFLYGAMGVLAIGLAVGATGRTEDLRGSLVLLPGGVVRGAILMVVILGLAAYVMWGFVRAIFDPLKRGSHPVAIVARLGFVWSALNYLALLVVAVAFLVGTTDDDGANTLHHTVSVVLSHDAGWVAIAIAGAIAILTGLGQFVDGYQLGFKKDLKRNQMSPLARVTADNLGRFGMFSRGVVFTMLGWFLLQAGLSHNADRVQNIQSIFWTLAHQPLGSVILGVVGLGFVALGLHSFACARWIRMLNV